MSKYLIDSNTMESIVSSIKQLSGNSETLNGANLASTLSSAAANKVNPPSGKIIITENATDVDVSYYATADIVVPTQKSPALLDTINISNFESSVNRINIDLTNYDINDYNIIFIVIDNVVFSKMDWLYISSANVSGTYFPFAQQNNLTKVFFTKINENEWRNMIHRQNGYPSTGDDLGIGVISFYTYYSDTIFESGRFLVYAL